MAAIAYVKPVEYPSRGISIEGAEKTSELFAEALKRANKELAAEGVVVLLKDPVDHTKNLTLWIQKDGVERPISIFDLKALDEVSLKSVEAMATEIVLKVKQHVTAEKTKGILISTSGSKFDGRRLENHELAIDVAGYITVDGNRLLHGGSKYVIPAERWSSYTVIRFLEDGDLLWPFDDYDLARENEKGACIDLTTVKKLSAEELMERSREGAVGYHGSYFVCERPTLKPEDKQRLYTELCKFPVP
jgi:hypothetical protein